jgi:O-antigen/teichoic acid export membrane protein
VLKLGSIVINIILVLFFMEVLPQLSAQAGIWSGLYHHEERLFYIFLSNFLASFITLLLLLPILRGFARTWDGRLFRKMISYSWPLVLVAIAGVIDQSSAITFQKYFLPYDLQQNLAEGGIYKAAASLALLLNLFTVAFNYAAEPFFFAHQDRADAKKIYADVALAFTIMGSIMMLFILAYLDGVQLLIGKNYRESLHVVPILLVAYLLLGVYYNISVWYKLTDKTKLGAWIAVTGALITILGNMILLPRIGVIGSAWAALACYVFMTAAAYWQGKKHYPVPYPVRKMILWIMSAVLLFVVMELLRPMFQGNLALILMINTLVLAIYLLAIGLIEKDLMRQLKRRPAA